MVVNFVRHSTASSPRGLSFRGEPVDDRAGPRPDEAPGLERRDPTVGGLEEVTRADVAGRIAAYARAGHVHVTDVPGLLRVVQGDRHRVLHGDVDVLPGAGIAAGVERNHRPDRTLDVHLGVGLGHGGPQPVRVPGRR